MIWLSAVCAVVIALIFPVFSDIYLFWGKDHQKLYFNVRIYRFIKIYGGYMQVVKEGLAFHVSETTVFILPFAEILDTRKKFQITKGFFLSRLRLLSEIGYGEDFMIPLMVTALIQAVSGALYGVLSQAKGSDVDFESDTIFGPGDKLHVFAHLRFVFNLLIVAIAGTKILLKKVTENGKTKQAG